MSQVTENSSEEQAPDGHYWTMIKDRRILVADLSPGQAMVLGGLWRKSKNADFDGNVDIFGKLMTLFETLVVRQEDREWLEEGILRGEIQVQDFANVFLGEARPVASDKPAKPKQRVRR